MVKVEVNKERETVTFSTVVTVDGKNLVLSVTKLLYYQKEKHLLFPNFKKTFYFEEEQYTNPKLNHHTYKRLVETNYKNESNERYEVQWKEMANCEHIETGAKGIIKGELKGTDKFPDQYGIFWTEGANHSNFGTHPYWNDKDKIRLLTNE